VKKGTGPERIEKKSNEVKLISVRKSFGVGRGTTKGGGTEDVETDGAGLPGSSKDVKIKRWSTKLL